MANAVGLGGAAGSGEAMAELIKQRLLQQQMDEVGRHNLASEGIDRETLASRDRDRQAVENENKRWHDMQDKQASEAKTITRLNLRPVDDPNPGGTRSMVSNPEHTAETAMGAPESLYGAWSPEFTGGQEFEKGGQTGPSPEGRPYLGTQVQRVAAQKANTGDAAVAERGDANGLDNLTKLMIAQLGNASRESIAKTNANKPGAMKTVSFRTKDGQNINALVNTNGEVVWAGSSQLPAGMKSTEADTNTMVDQIDAIEKAGAAGGWHGVGVLTAPFQGLRKRVTGGGSNADDNLRTMIDSLNADIAHAKYGSAFTVNERAQLQNYAPNSRMSAQAIQNRLAIMKRVGQQRLQEIAGGATPETATPLRLAEDAPTAPLNGGGASAAPPGQAPQSPDPLWRYVPKPGGGWQAVPATQAQGAR